MLISPFCGKIVILFYLLYSSYHNPPMFTSRTIWISNISSSSGTVRSLGWLPYSSITPRAIHSLVLRKPQVSLNGSRSYTPNFPEGSDKLGCWYQVSHRRSLKPVINGTRTDYVCPLFSWHRPTDIASYQDLFEHPSAWDVLGLIHMFDIKQKEGYNPVQFFSMML